MGIIDSLSAGYRLISRRWWLVLIPILLDLFLWMGPRLAMTQMMDEAAAMLTIPADVEVDEGFASFTEQMQQSMELYQMQTRDLNMFTLLTSGLPGTPSLMATTTTDVSLLPAERTVIQVGGIGTAILWGLLLLVGGTLFTSLYVSWIGRSVLTEYRDIESVPALEHSLKTWGQVLLFMLGILALILILGIPIGFLGSFLMLLSPNFGIMVLYVISLFMLWFGVWLIIYLFFVINAVVLDRVKIFKAIWNSINVVLRNFWPTFGLIALIFLINRGMTLIWQQLAFASWSLLIGIVANAFVGTGLIAASLIFYNERFTRWQEDPGPTGVRFLFRNRGGPPAS